VSKKKGIDDKKPQNESEETSSKLREKDTIKSMTTGDGPGAEDRNYREKKETM